MLRLEDELRPELEERELLGREELDRDDGLGLLRVADGEERVGLGRLMLGVLRVGIGLGERIVGVLRVGDGFEVRTVGVLYVGIRGVDTVGDELVRLDVPNDPLRLELLVGANRPPLEVLVAGAKFVA